MVRSLDDLMPSIDAEILVRLGRVCQINDRDVRGIWYDDYLEALGQDATMPEFHCRTIDVEWVRQNDRLLKGDVSYRVAGTPIHHSGGITRLRLVKG